MKILIFLFLAFKLPAQLMYGDIQAVLLSPSLDTAYLVIEYQDHPREDRYFIKNIFTYKEGVFIPQQYKKINYTNITLPVEDSTIIKLVTYYFKNYGQMILIYKE